MSYETIRAQPSATIDNSDRDLTSLQARTLPPVSTATPGSRDHLQRVAAAPKDHQRAFSLFSQEPGQQDSRPIGIENLLNPVKCEDRLNASGAHSSLSLPRTNADLLDSLRSDTHSLSLARSYPYRQVSQEAPYRQAQSFERPCTVNPEPSQPASRGESPNTQYSSYNRISQIESGTVSPVAFTGQPQYFPSCPSSGPSWTVPKMFEIPPSDTAAPNQYGMMVLKTEHGSIQVPVDVQIASKVEDEKRKRNATASHRFRQRRKEKERETSDKIAKLEAQIRETEEDRDHYRTERDHLRDIAIRHCLYVAPRPPTPNRIRLAAMNERSLVQVQETERSRQNGGHTRQISKIVCQDSVPSAVWPPLQTPIY